MSISNSEKSTIPRCSDSVRNFELSHFENFNTLRCEVDRITTKATKIATSSSSPICASLAASTSSLATENDTETLKSAPTAEREVAIPVPFAASLRGPPLATHALSSSSCFATYCDVRRCAGAVGTLTFPTLANRASDDASVRMWSCYLAPRAAPMRKKRGGNRYERAMVDAFGVGGENSGSIFGCLLGDLVRSLGVTGVSSSFLIRSIRACLEPVAAAALGTDGVDARTLCAALASAKPLNAQISMISEAPPRLHTSRGSAWTVIGATAAIYTFFSLATSTMGGACSAETVQSIAILGNLQLERALDSALHCARHSAPMTAPNFELAGIDAEIRSLQRARKAVGEAAAFTAGPLAGDPLGRLRVALSWFLRAAWPVGEVVNERTHDALLARLVPAFFLAAPAAPCAEPVDVMPLEQLEAVRGGPCDSDTSSRSSASSAGSFVS